MKKPLVISLSLIAALIVGVGYYFISIPNKVDAVLTGSVGTDGRCVINVAGTPMSYGCNEAYPGGSPVGGLGPGQVNCFNNGTCEYQVWGGSSYGGTIGTDVYFTQATATAFMQGGGTQEQASAIDGIYTACQNLIASKPTSDVEFDPRGTLNCLGYWGCDGLSNTPKCLLDSAQQASGCVRTTCNPTEPPSSIRCLGPAQR